MSDQRNEGCEPNPPLGGDAVGEEVARDFGEEHGGIFYGKVASVTGDRRVLYRVEYTDGDQEDHGLCKLLERETLAHLKLHEVGKDGPQER